MDEAVGEAEDHDGAVGEAPGSGGWVPDAAHEFDGLADRDFVVLESDVNEIGYRGAAGAREPIDFFNNQLHRFVSLLAGVVIAIAYADNSRTVLFDELARSGLARPESETRPEHCKLRGSLGMGRTSRPTLEEIERTLYAFGAKPQDMCIDHCGRDVSVTEKLLHSADVLATLEQMCRE